MQRFLARAAGPPEGERLLLLQKLRARAAQRKGEYRRAGDETLKAMCAHSLGFLRLGLARQFALAVAGGAFVAFGALLSVALSEGIEAAGPAKFMLGLGFAAGFSLVVLTGSALYTEVNVSLSIVLLAFGRRVWRPVARFWAVVLAGNLGGALLVSAMMRGAAALDDAGLQERLLQVVAKKLVEVDGGAAGWFRVVCSGVLANWLVGLAAFNAASARTLTGKVAGLFFPIISFSVLGFQHSPANMGYLAAALINGLGGGLDALTWGNAFAWNIVPAALGNLVGGSTLVGAFFFYTSSPVMDGGGGGDGGGDDASDADALSKPLAVELAAIAVAPATEV